MNFEEDINNLGLEADHMLDVEHGAEEKEGIYLEEYYSHYHNPTVDHMDEVAEEGVVAEVER